MFELAELATNSEPGHRGHRSSARPAPPSARFTGLYHLSSALRCTFVMVGEVYTLMLVRGATRDLPTRRDAPVDGSTQVARVNSINAVRV